ncbi:nitrate assimilation regulatory protein nirA, partial [Dactylonectria estremocensis]
CDAQNPCQRCDKASEKCEYNRKRWESKTELRAEIVRLKRSNEDRDNLLRSFASGQDLDPFGRQGLVDGNKSYEDHLEGAEEDVGSSPVPSQKAILRREPVGLSCFDHLHSWRLCRPSISDRNLLSGISERSTILSLPPLPLDAYTSEWHTPDMWTRTGWTRAHLRHLFDALTTWDYLPFSLLCKDQFLQDYQSGSSRFCSSALVHAVLALASRLINENDDDARLLPSGWLGSKMFLDEAEAILQARGPLNRLPDIQALGILSLYQMRCGREAEAHELAEAFVASITELCQREPLMDKEEEQYSRARATTYCGAVSLVRILHLTTGLLFDVPSHTLQEDSLILDEPSYSSMGNSQGRSSTRPYLATDVHNSQQRDLQLITAKMFQLTEWVHKLITSARSAPGIASNDIVAVYNKCLDWYESLFALVNRDGTRTPFMLFVHMYYHFCILCAFRLFVSLAVGESDIQPHEICTQAAQSILALAQSYDDLFTLRRVSGLVPYFICASGLYGLGMIDSGSAMDPVHLRLRDQTPPMIKFEPDMYETVVNHSGASAPPSHLKMSAAAHARLLLAKIGSTHPVATMAERMI